MHGVLSSSPSGADRHVARERAQELFDRRVRVPRKNPFRRTDFLRSTHQVMPTIGLRSVMILSTKFEQKETFLHAYFEKATFSNLHAQADRHGRAMNDVAETSILQKHVP